MNIGPLHVYRCPQRSTVKPFIYMERSFVSRTKEMYWIYVGDTEIMFVGPYSWKSLDQILDAFAPKWLIRFYNRWICRPAYWLQDKWRDYSMTYRLRKAWLFVTFRWAPWYVNIYDVGRAYGGPEEGGWYYDYGTPCKEAFGKVTFRCWSHDQAIALAEELRKKIVQPDTYIQPMSEFKLGKFVPHINRYSVIGDKDIEAHVESEPAHEWPEERPRYC